MDMRDQDKDGSAGWRGEFRGCEEGWTRDING